MEYTTTKKNLVLSYVSDYNGCGFIRNILPTTYLNAVFGSREDIRVITSPVMIFQPDILQRTRSILFQRTMGDGMIDSVRKYKEMQKKYKFKMIYDIDDYVWGDDIPDYNMGYTIPQSTRSSSLEIIKLMDIVCVSTTYLKDSLIAMGINENKIEVVHNTLPQFLWGLDKKPLKTEKIIKPTVLWSSSPSHWDNQNKLYGDMDNSWREWIIKSVKEDKINYIQLGGLPWFFEEIRDKIRYCEWINTLHYPHLIKSFNTDFGISPIVDNIFNYAKSPLKYQEYCVSGIVGIGTVFDDNKNSPYEVSITKVSNNITVDEIDDLVFNKLVYPEVYNKIIADQYTSVVDNGWNTENKNYINKLLSIL